MITEKNNYRHLTARECAEALSALEAPTVLIHVHPDGDAVGSGAALCEIFSQLGKPAALLAPEKIPARLGFITDFCGTRLAESTDFSCGVSIDVASPAQLGRLFSPENPPRLMIDHHAVGEMLADGYIIPDASSAGEVLFEIAEELIALGKIKMNERLAYALYAAISSDTGRFCFSNTSPLTHIRAARLLECGIDSADINNRLFFSKSAGQIKAEGFIGSSLKTAADGRIAYSSVSLRDIKELSLSQEDFDTAIDIVRSISGCEVALLAKELEEGKYKLSMRSVGADVASVAKKFGGGGHIRAAGCTVSAENAEEALRAAIAEIMTEITGEG